MIKKIMAFILALLCTLSLVACDGGEAEARLAAEGFMNAFVALDKEALSSYMVDPSAVPEEFDELNIDKAMEEIPAEMSAYTDDFKAALTDMINKIKSGFAYEIKEGTKRDGDFVFTVNVTTPDSDSINIEKIMEEKFNQNALNTIATELLNSGAITATSTQEEILGVVMPKVISLMKEVFDQVTIQTETEDIELIVTQKDGKWLVDADTSTLLD